MIRLSCAVLLAAWCGCLAGSCLPAQDIRSITTEWKQTYQLSEFYAQGIDAGGIPILASRDVSPEALVEAKRLIGKMLASAPEVTRALINARVRVTVMSADERTTDVPEHAFLTPKDHWDRRARGLGATPQVPVVSCGEENLLGFTGDPYRGENILVHEFSHAVHEVGLLRVDPTFDGRLQQAFKAAIKKGLWKGTYAATDHKEYFAEGSQSWFECNAEAGHVHNDIRTREQLKRYDPELAQLLAQAYGDNNWAYEGVPKTEVKSKKAFRWEK